LKASIDPIWFLSRISKEELSDEQIIAGFLKFEFWHNSFQFEGGLSFSAHHKKAGHLADDPKRPLQRSGHFVPYLVGSINGDLKDKRILDIGCSSGFWSIQFALLGADVIGFDSRPELISQANLIKSIVCINNVDFKVLDFWDMSQILLEGTFDIVLNLGILSILPKPILALELTKLMAREIILSDTRVYPTYDTLIKLRWEDPFDIRTINESSIVALPSKSSIELICKHLNFCDWFEIPIHTQYIP